MKKNKHHDGFTLIELLVVIAIIGLLSSIVLASLNTARAKGRDAKVISQIKSIQTALELYRSTNGSYPSTTDITAIGLFPRPPEGGSMSTALAGLVSGGYISAIPYPPSTSTFYGYITGGGTFTTCDTNDSSLYPYVLYFSTENPQPNLKPGAVGKGAGNPANTYCMTIQ